MQIRISGLVKFFNLVSAQLQRGIPRRHIPTFKKDVKQVVEDVDRLCAIYNASPEELPAPSQKAYQFLKNLNFETLPVTDTENQEYPGKSFTVPGAVGRSRALALRMWRERSSIIADPVEIQQEITRQITYIRSYCDGEKISIEQLSAQTARAYCWLTFLQDEDNLEQHMGSLQMASKMLSKIWRFPGWAPIDILMLNIQSLYRARSSGNRVVISCSEGFIAADESIWKALLLNILKKRVSDRRQTINRFVNSASFSEVLFEIELALPNHNLQSSGTVYCLKESFDRVNNAYFAGEMERPKLTWNRTLTQSKFGHYQPSRDLVMLSISLDRQQVPEYVVDFVMYHELLHKKHGVQLVNGRRFAHTPLFRKDEKRFKNYRQSMQWLQKFVTRN
ncbi:MAG: hypothetical protein ACRBF0_19155 [Calditrichia bacterium]